jgi:hypothetical protein
MPFQKGNAANPRGRPRGSTNMPGEDKLLATAVDTILEKVVNAALSGDIAAAPSRPNIFAGCQAPQSGRPQGRQRMTDARHCWTLC